MKNLTIRGYGITDKGLVRPTNEDYYTIQEKLFMVADGMGGHNAGEVASKFTIDNILLDVNNFFHSKSVGNDSAVDYQDLIERMIQNANRRVIQKATKEPLYNGMGTTLVMALFQEPNTMHIANVGDSRAYLLRKNELRMISKDHSLAKVMIHDFNLSNEEVKSNRYQKYLTRAIGMNSKIEPYYTSITLISGDKILLCSDGLWNMVDEKDIMNILQKDRSDLLKCKEFIKKAKESGGVDNITVIIISTIDS